MSDNSYSETMIALAKTRLDYLDGRIVYLTAHRKALLSCGLQELANIIGEEISVLDQTMHAIQSLKDHIERLNRELQDRG